MKAAKIFSLLAFVAIAPWTLAQSTQRLTAVKANDYGLVYTLPTTVVDVTIEATITERQPGEFYKYAKKYLNADNPITTPSMSATVKSVVITTHGEVDQQQRYLVTLKSNFAPYINVSDDNIPLSINTSEVMHKAAEQLPVNTPAAPTPLQTDAARQVITEDMLRSNSSAKRAELAAEQIYALRQSRTDLITGQAEQMPPDGQAMQLILDNIEAQEKALTAMFMGTESTRTVVRTFSFIPDGDVADRVIARVSAVNGIVSPDDLSGAPVYISVKVTEQGVMPVNDKDETLPFPKGGVAYCIPGKATITVSYDGRAVASKSVALAQLGVVYGMNPNNFTDKKSPVYIIFDPATGAITETGPATLPTR